MNTGAINSISFGIFTRMLKYIQLDNGYTSKKEYAFIRRLRRMNRYDFRMLSDEQLYLFCEIYTRYCDEKRKTQNNN